MKVRDILKTKGREVITIEPSAGVTEAMRLLISRKISCLPVLNESGELLGIISDKDIFKRVYDDPENFVAAQVGELMSTNLIVGIPGDDIMYIAGIMTNNKIRHVPIVEDRRLVGLVSVGDVVKTQMEHINIENRYLKQYIDGTYPG